MKRLLRLQSMLLKEIDKYEKLVPERDKFMDWERVHMSSCARLGYLMAGSSIDEIVKDADVIDFYQYGFGFDREEQKIRYERMLESDGKIRF